MRIKSLLLATLVACMSFAAHAETAYTNVGDKMRAPDFTIKAGETTGEDGVALTMTRVDPKATDFTNIQLDIVFPVDKNGKGLRPVEIDGVYGWAGSDIPMIGKPKVPCVHYNNNFDMPEKYPVHTVVGVNMTKTAIEANPCQLYNFYLAADEGMLTGDYQIKVKNIKYTIYANDSFATADEQVVCTVHVEGRAPGVPSDPDILKRNDKLTTGNFTVEPGQTLAMPISLKRENSNSFTHYDVDFIFPEGIHPLNATANPAHGSGSLVFDINHPYVHVSNGHSTSTGKPYCEWNSITANPFEILTMDVAIDENIADGEYPIKARNLTHTNNCKLDGMTGLPIYSTEGEQVVGTITVKRNTPVDPTPDPTDITFTDVSKLNYALYCDEVKTRKNKQVEVKINMKNATPICLWQADLVLPNGVTIAEDELGAPMIFVSGNRTTPYRHSVESNTVNGITHLLCSSNANKNFIDNDGEVATIVLNTASDLADGEYPLILRSQLMVEDNAVNSYKVDSVVSKFIVKNFILGDVNDDELINGVDLVGLTNFILERPNEGCIWEAADVNTDGEVNGSDYVLEVNAILGKITLQSPAIKKVASSAAPQEDYAIYADDLTTEPDCLLELPVNVKNDNAFTLWQADFELPDGFTLAMDEDFGELEPMVAITGNRTSYRNHGISANVLSNGDIRVLCSSQTNKDFKGNDGEVATISIDVAENVKPGEYVIKIKNGLIVESNNTEHKVKDLEVVVTVSGLTGINNITVNNGKVNVFNTFGQLVKSNVDAANATQGLSNGIYIVGNKKVVVRK